MKKVQISQVMSKLVLPIQDCKACRLQLIPFLPTPKTSSWPAEEREHAQLNLVAAVVYYLSSGPITATRVERERDLDTRIGKAVKGSKQVALALPSS